MKSSFRQPLFWSPKGGPHRSILWMAGACQDTHRNAPTYTRFNYIFSMSPTVSKSRPSVSVGEGVALLGSNGAGKTTLLASGSANLLPNAASVVFPAGGFPG